MEYQPHRETLYKRILVVDDKEPVRQFLGHHLARECFDVEAVDDGGAAIDRLQSDAAVPDAVVLDLEMPVMDGFETLRRLDEITDEVVTVVLSAYDDEEHQLRAFELGADDFVAKPFSPDVLVTRLRRLLERSNSTEWPGEWHATEPVERNTGS